MDWDTPGRIISWLGIMPEWRKTFSNWTFKINSMYFAITEVTPLENYKLRLKFKNGEEKIFDMGPYLNTGIFKELKMNPFLKRLK